MTAIAARTGLRRDILLAALDDAIFYRDGAEPGDAALAEDYRRELEQLRAASDEDVAALTAQGGN